MDIEKVIEGRVLIDGEITYTEVGIAYGRIFEVGRMVRVGY